MKYYKQILEAINKGIQLALDDFDDEESPIQNIKSKQVQNRDYTKEYLDLLKYEVVDLGLPSGTLWCRYNLDVDPNQLSKPEDWYGKYYAWGELEGNKRSEGGWITFQWDNYKFGNERDLTKYCNNSKYGLNGFTDNLTELHPEDDTAYQFKKYHSFKFHIPTKEQFEELIKYTSNYWVNNYNPNKIIHNPEDDGGIKGLNGRVFEGNGDIMFIPAAGYYYYKIGNMGLACLLWASNLKLDNPNEAYYLAFGSNSIGIYSSNRYHGLSVRPVLNLNE